MVLAYVAYHIVDKKYNDTTFCKCFGFTKRLIKVILRL